MPGSARLPRTPTSEITQSSSKHSFFTRVIPFFKPNQHDSARRPRIHHGIGLISRHRAGRTLRDCTACVDTACGGDLQANQKQRVASSSSSLSSSLSLSIDRCSLLCCRHSIRSQSSTTHRIPPPPASQRSNTAQKYDESLYIIGRITTLADQNL